MQTWMTTYYSPLCFSVQKVYEQLRDELVMDKKEYLPEVALVDYVLKNTKSKRPTSDPKILSKHEHLIHPASDHSRHNPWYLVGTRALSIALLVLLCKLPVDVDQKLLALTGFAPVFQEQFIVSLLEEPFP